MSWIFQRWKEKHELKMTVWTRLALQDCVFGSYTMICQISVLIQMLSVLSLAYILHQMSNRMMGTEYLLSTNQSWLIIEILPRVSVVCRNISHIVLLNSGLKLHLCCMNVHDCLLLMSRCPAESESLSPLMRVYVDKELQYILSSCSILTDTCKNTCLDQPSATGKW